MSPSHSLTLSIADAYRTSPEAMGSRSKGPSGATESESFDKVYQAQADSIEAGSHDNNNNYNDLENDQAQRSKPDGDEKELPNTADAAKKDEKSDEMEPAGEALLRSTEAEIPIRAEHNLSTEEDVFENELLHGINIALPTKTARSKIGENIPVNGKELPLGDELTAGDSVLTRPAAEPLLRSGAINAPSEIPIRGHADSNDAGDQPSLRKSIGSNRVHSDSLSNEIKLDNAPSRALADPLPESLSLQLSSPAQEQGNTLATGANSMSNLSVAVSQVDSQAVQKPHLSADGILRSDLQVGARNANLDWSNAIGEKVHWMRNANISTAELHLHPAELGSIEIRIVTEDQQARVSFVTSSAAARDAIESSLPKLREMLADSGLLLEQSDISQRDSRDQGAQKNQHARSDMHPWEKAEERTFIAPALPSRIGQVDQYV